MKKAWKTKEDGKEDGQKSRKQDKANEKAVKQMAIQDGNSCKGSKNHCETEKVLFIGSVKQKAKR